MDSNSKIAVSLPKFRVESTHQLVEPLKQQLGLTSMFDPLEADFNGIAEVNPPLCVSGVVQKTFVEVNEEGTEAAAVTAMMMIRGGDEPIEFNVDRPFMFQIIWKPCNLVLFTGSVTNPNECMNFA